jgi:hypothetical protein
MRRGARVARLLSRPLLAATACAAGGCRLVHADDEAAAGPPANPFAPRRDKTCSPVSRDDDYISDIKIWGVGIKQDPIPGEKRGKGIQHLNSSYWMYDLATFIEHR